MVSSLAKPQCGQARTDSRMTLLFMTTSPPKTKRKHHSTSKRRDCSNERKIFDRDRVPCRDEKPAPARAVGGIKAAPNPSRVQSRHRPGRGRIEGAPWRRATSAERPAGRRDSHGMNAKRGAGTWAGISSGKSDQKGPGNPRRKSPGRLSAEVRTADYEEWLAGSRRPPGRCRFLSNRNGFQRLRPNGALKEGAVQYLSLCRELERRDHGRAIQNQMA